MVDVEARSGSTPRRRSGRALPDDSAPLNAGVSFGDSKDVVEKKARRSQSNGSAKLGTFAGVFVPTSLNVFSILMFLRFGFILGQSGVLGIMAMLIATYAIDLLTTLSISAIATNGTVRGGGAYYLISRSLGPEFGGAIGIVFYLGCAFNTGMNAVGLVDCLNYNFAVRTGGWANWLPDGFWWSYLWATVVLVICTVICLAGSSLFARASNALLVLLLVATFSIPISALIRRPFDDPKHNIIYTGPSLETFKGNLFPKLTKGADGSMMDTTETWQDLFGILFPAASGIFAGASMSGDLKHPSKAIPKGTLYGLVLTFVAYVLVILSLAATVPRWTLYRNVNVIQDINLSETIVLLGEFATSFFSALMGVIGSAKLLQALARDHLIPGFGIFGQGSEKSDEPRYAILITYVVAQLTMLFDINSIAAFVTMSYLMTFLITNLACFLLKISSAPNFRPSFRYFSWQSAVAGTVVSAGTMFFVDEVAASGCVAIMIVIFLLIHYTTPPKSWGDVSQSLIYHQIRKYLLRLRQDHVKFWRPSVLLLVNDPRRQYKLIQFCNSLKKGALFILGHVIVTDDFKGSVPEARKQQASWSKYIDFSKIKAFINIAVSPRPEWGIRNMVLSSGLGGMRPNIVVLGIFNLKDLRDTQPLIDIPSPRPSRPSSVNSSRESKASKSRRLRDERVQSQQFPTDSNRPEGAISARSYVAVLEDLLLRLRINVAVAKGFNDLELPEAAPSHMERIMKWLSTTEDTDDTPTKYIDLWPVQMSAISEITAEGEQTRNILTTNFDTYTLILQLGCILATVSSWSRTFTLRVSVFVEYESDVEEERQRISSLLSNLRIKADTRVFWLASGDLKTYEVVVNGKQNKDLSQTMHDTNEALEDEAWWDEVQSARRQGMSENLRALAELDSHVFPSGRKHVHQNSPNPKGLRRILRRVKRRVSVGPVNQFPTEMRLQLSSLDPNLVDNHRSYASASESSSSEEDFTDSESERAASEGDLESSSDDETERSIHRSQSFHTNPKARHISQRSLDMPRSPLTHRLLLTHQDSSRSETSEGAATAPSGTRSPVPGTLRRPPTIRHQSLPKFTSKPVPRTEVASEDGPGPSIMFADQATKDPPAINVSEPETASRTATPKTRPISPVEELAESIPSLAGTTEAASGFPAQQSVPLSFNDLPARAQHLILNELMVKHSEQTAVLFTTLPSPVEDTCESELDSIRYLSDLEVLINGLPPTLLVHSNTVTVTMSL